MKNIGREIGYALEFSDLVSSISKTRIAILTLSVNIDLSSESGGYPRKFLNGRGAEEKVLSGNTSERLRKRKGSHCF